MKPALLQHTLTRLLTTVLGLLTAAGALNAATATSAFAQVTESSVIAPNTYETGVQYWINRVRSQHGLSKLRIASCTDDVAEHWSAHLAKTGGFYHQSMTDVLDRCDAQYAGETLGRGGMTPRHLVQLWMESPAHRAVLLSGKSRRIGVGAELDALGRWVVAANFMRF
jgi:uncharacterized protein YkwD